MFKLKNLLTLAFFLISATNYCAGANPIANQEMFTFVSTEGKEFNVPKQIATQSKMVTTALESDNVNKLSVQINSNYLNILTKAMNLIAQNNQVNKKLLYENIIGKLPANLPLSTIVNLFKEAIELDFPVLENLFADHIAKRLINPDSSVNIARLNEVINLFGSVQFLSDTWYLIEKFYYLRSPLLKPGKNSFLLKNNPKLVDLFNNKSEKIIKQWKLSIKDLVDYNKNLIENTKHAVEDPNRTEIFNGIHYAMREIINAVELDLRGFFFVSIDGLQKIPNIKNVTGLWLDNNQLTTLGNNLNGLDRLEWLSVDGNQLTDLTGIKDVISKLTIFRADENPLNKASVNLIREWKKNNPH